MNMKRFLSVRSYLEEQAEKQNILNKYCNKEPFIDEFLGIEDRDGDLVVWFNKNNELDCWVLAHYFDLYYTEYRLEQLYNMWFESVCKNK